MDFTSHKFNLYQLEQSFIFNNFFLQDIVKLATHKRRQFLKEISSRRKSVPLVVTKKNYYQSSPRRNNWFYFQEKIKDKSNGSFEIDNRVPLRGIIRFHLIIYFHFALKFVNYFYSKLFYQGEASFYYQMFAQYVWIVKRKKFLLSGRAIFHCRYKSLKLLSKA